MKYNLVKLKFTYIVGFLTIGYCLSLFGFSLAWIFIGNGELFALTGIGFCACFFLYNIVPSRKNNGFIEFLQDRIVLRLENFEKEIIYSQGEIKKVEFRNRIVPQSFEMLEVDLKLIIKFDEIEKVFYVDINKKCEVNRLKNLLKDAPPPSSSFVTRMLETSICNANKKVMSGDRYKIQDQHACHFITMTVIYWIDIFSRKEYRDIVVDSLNYCVQSKGLKLNAWVIMSNHIHIVGPTRPRL